jgi:predicted enzyme related to lactoylglutathione lyase
MFSEARLATLIPIRDMDRAIKFYTKALGGKELMRGDGEMKDFWASLKLGTNEVWLITPQKREKRTLAYSTFIVKNIKTAVNELKRKGVKFSRPTKMSPDTRIDGPIAYESVGASAFFKDTEGNLLMIWQSPVPM